MSQIVTLDNATKEMQGTLGGKGAMLGELKLNLSSLSEEVYIPDGFGIQADAFKDWMHSGGVTDAKISAALKMAGKDVSALKALSDMAVEKLKNHPIPNDLVEDVMARIDSNGHYAVRSSGIGEDGVDMSFAGEHDSFLNVGKTGVMGAVRKVWLSTMNPRALYYRAANEKYDDPLRQGVVVMDMVESPDFAGVAFSADTRTGSRKHGLVEYVKGLGDKLVAGEVTPETYMFVKESLEKSANPMMNRVAQTVIELEKIFGWPADIEWAAKNDKLYLLQLRPLTALPDALSDTQITQMELTHPEHGLPVHMGTALTGGQVDVRGFVSREQARDPKSRWKLDKRILLVPYTTPDDMDILEKVAGVVVSRGGATSHAAITCREFHRPCMKVDSLKIFNHNGGTGLLDFKDTVQEGYLNCNLPGAKAAWYRKSKS